MEILEYQGAQIRVVIADDHRLTRETLKEILELAGDIAIVGEAATGEEAIQLAGELLPDVVLMDIGMPDMNGIEAARRIFDINPWVYVLILTSHKDRACFVDSLAAGVNGYCLKDSEPETLCNAVRRASRGELWFESTMLEAFKSGAAKRTLIETT